jgi:hypothetical protein
MYQKICFPIFYFLGILSLIVGILAKMFGFMLFDLKPSRYLLFAGVCALYAIASLLCTCVCKPEKS